MEITYMPINEYPNLEANVAINLAEKWGIVAAMPDGEDSSGRAKLRLSTPDEVVARACDVAEKLVAAMRAKKWLHTTPPWGDEDSKDI